MEFRAGSHRINRIYNRGRSNTILAKAYSIGTAAMLSDKASSKNK
ncbi:hypothetical protein [Clostridium sp. UBA1056]